MEALLRLLFSIIIALISTALASIVFMVSTNLILAEVVNQIPQIGYSTAFALVFGIQMCYLAVIGIKDSDAEWKERLSDTRSYVDTAFDKLVEALLNKVLMVVIFCPTIYIVHHIIF